MKIGIDISQIVYGTGVSDYTLNLLANLPQESIVPFGFSLRQRNLLKGLTFPFPSSVMEFVWNRLHIINVETFTGTIDVYHSSDWTQAPSKAKKVTTVHDLTPFIYPQEMDAKIVEVHTRRMKWVVSECDKIICVSQNTANDLQRLFSVSEDKIVVITEAIPSRFLLTPRLTKNTNYLVAIGARQPRKNISRLVEAYLKFKDKLELPQKLIIVGENSLETSNPSITYTGYVDDQSLVDLLAGSEAFIYPSLYEGFGLPILGAFHHNIPVAAANTSSIPEVAGDAAVYFDPIDIEEMANAIRKAIDNKKDLVGRGKEQLSKFSWAKTAAETVKVYNSVI